MINDNITAKGQLRIYLNGKLDQTHNLVVDVGKAWIAKRMAGQDQKITHMGVGTGSAAASAAQTALAAEVARKALLVAGGEVAGRTVTHKATFLAGEATANITEAGLFTAFAAGTMVARSNIGPYNKNPNDVLTIEWDITIS